MDEKPKERQQRKMKAEVSEWMIVELKMLMAMILLAAAVDAAAHFAFRALSSAHSPAC